MFKRRNIPFLIDKDNKIKVVSDRISTSEKFFEELCITFAGVLRKLAGYRDKNDILAKLFLNYTEEEDINQSLINGLKNFTKTLTILGDYMDIQIHRVEMKVLNELAQYEAVCKTAKENLRSAALLRDKELSRQKQLMDIKTKFSVNSSAADSELLKANIELDRAQKRIDEISYDFEKQKLSDLKTILLDYVQIQMKMHSRALEILSATYYDIANINEKQDLQNFKKIFKQSEKKLNSDFKSKSLEHIGMVKPKNKSFRQSSKDLSTTLSENEDEEVTEDDKSNDVSTSSEAESQTSEDENSSYRASINRKQTFRTK